MTLPNGQSRKKSETGFLCDGLPRLDFLNDLTLTIPRCLPRRRLVTDVKPNQSYPYGVHIIGREGESPRTNLGSKIDTSKKKVETRRPENCFFTKLESWNFNSWNQTY